MLRKAILFSLLATSILLPRSAHAEDAAPTTAPRPLDRFTGNISIGTALLVKSDTSALGTFRLGGTRWFDNVGLASAVGTAANGDSLGIGLDLGMRVLGSSSRSGPFAGAGLGISYWDLRPKTGFRGDGASPYGYVELGIIARGTFTVSVRADLLLVELEGHEVGATTQDKRRLAPIPLTAQIGFMF